VETSAAPEHALLAYIGKRDRAQIEMDLIAELFPEIVGRATGLIATAPDRRAGSTPRCTDRLIDGKNDVGDASLAAVMGEQIATTRAAYTLPQAMRSLSSTPFPR